MQQILLYCKKKNTTRKKTPTPTHTQEAERAENETCGKTQSREASCRSAVVEGEPCQKPTTVESSSKGFFLHTCAARCARVSSGLENGRRRNNAKNTHIPQTHDHPNTHTHRRKNSNSARKDISQEATTVLLTWKMKCGVKQQKNTELVEK